MPSLQVISTSRILRSAFPAINLRYYFRVPWSRPGAQNAPRRFRQFYHSVQYPSAQPTPLTENTILSNALVHVPHHGFSTRSLLLGAKDAGYREVSAQLFPRGVFDLIHFYLVTQRLTMRDRVQFPEDTKLSVESKVRILILERLRANANIIHQWQGV